VASEVRLEVGRFHDHHPVECQAAGEDRAKSSSAHLAGYCVFLPSVDAVATVRTWLRDHLRRSGTGLNSRRMVQSRMRGYRLARTGRAIPKRRRSALSSRDDSATAIIIVP